MVRHHRSSSDTPPTGENPEQAALAQVSPGKAQDSSKASVSTAGREDSVAKPAAPEDAIEELKATPTEATSDHKPDTDTNTATTKVIEAGDEDGDDEVLVAISSDRPIPSSEGDPAIDSLEDIFTQEDSGSMMADQLLYSKEVTQIAINSYNKIIFTNHTGTHVAANGFPSKQDYKRWIASTLRLTNLSNKNVLEAGAVTSGIFTSAVKGSIHISPESLTGSDPAVLIKRWPTSTATLDQLASGKVLSSEIRVLLEASVRGRTGVLVSGPSGVGKSGMVRALSLMIEPSSRVISVEHLPELDLSTNLPNTVSLSDPKAIELGALLASAISMRPDRLVVGEIDRVGWLPLTKFSTSGGTGFIAATPSISPQLAIDGALDALKAHGYSPEHAAELLVASIGIVVHLGRGARGRRVVSSVSELSRNGGHLNLHTLNRFDVESDAFLKVGEPSQRLTDGWAGWGVLPTAPVTSPNSGGKQKP